MPGSLQMSPQNTMLTAAMRYSASIPSPSLGRKLISGVNTMSSIASSVSETPGSRALEAAGPSVAVRQHEVVETGHTDKHFESKETGSAEAQRTEAG